MPELEPEIAKDEKKAEKGAPRIEPELDKPSSSDKPTPQLLPSEAVIADAKRRLINAGTVVEADMSGDRSGAPVSFERTLAEAQKVVANKTEKVILGGAAAEVDRDAKGEILRVKTNGITSERIGPNTWVSTSPHQVVQFQTEGNFVQDGDSLKFERKDGRPLPDVKQVMSELGLVEIKGAKFGDVEANSVKASVIGVSATGDVIRKVEELSLADGRTFVRQETKGDKFAIKYPNGETLAFMGNMAIKDSPEGPVLKFITPYPKHEAKVTVQVLGADGRELIMNVKGQEPSFPSQRFDLSAPSVDGHANLTLKRDLGISLSEAEASKRLQLVDSISTGPEVHMQFKIQLNAAETADLTRRIAEEGAGKGLEWAQKGTVAHETIEEKIAKGFKFESKGAVAGAYERDSAAGDLTSTEVDFVEPNEKNGLKEPHLVIGRRLKSPHEGKLAPIGGFFDSMPAKEGQPRMVESYKMARVREGDEEAAGGKIPRERSWLSSVSFVRDDPRNQGTGDHFSFTPITMEIAKALRTGDDMGYVKPTDPIAHPLSEEPRHFGLLPVSEVNANRRILAFDYGRQIQEDGKLGLPQADLDRMKEINRSEKNKSFEIVGYRVDQENGGERVPVIAAKLENGRPVFASMEEAAKAYEEFANEFKIKRAHLTEEATSGRWISAELTTGKPEQNKAAAENAVWNESDLVKKEEAERAAAAKTNAEASAADRARDNARQNPLWSADRDAITRYINKKLETARLQGDDLVARAIERAQADKPLDGFVFNRKASQDVQAEQAYRFTKELLAARTVGALEDAIAKAGAETSTNPADLKAAIEAERALKPEERTAVERLISSEARRIKEHSLDEHEIEKGRALERALAGKTIDGWVFDRNLSENSEAKSAYDTAARMLSATTQGQLTRALEQAAEIKGDTISNLRRDLNEFSVEIDSKTRELIRQDVLNTAKKMADAGDYKKAEVLRKIANGESLSRSETREIAPALRSYRAALDPDRTKTLGDLTSLPEFRDAQKFVTDAHAEMIARQERAEKLVSRYDVFHSPGTTRNADGSITVVVLDGVGVDDTDKAAIDVAKKSGVDLKFEFAATEVVAKHDGNEGDVKAQVAEEQQRQLEQIRARELEARSAQEAADALRIQIADQTPLTEAATSSIRDQLLKQAGQIQKFAERPGMPANGVEAASQAVRAITAIAEGRYEDAAAGKIAGVDAGFVTSNPELKLYSDMLKAKTPAELKALAQFPDETGGIARMIDTALNIDHLSKSQGDNPLSAAEQVFKDEVARAAADKTGAELRALIERTTDPLKREQLEKLAAATPEQRGRFVEMINSTGGKAISVAIVLGAALTGVGFLYSKKRALSTLPTFSQGK